MSRAALVSGVCRYCGCTEDAPCRIPGDDTCSWHDAQRTVCTGPKCLGQYFAEDVEARRRDYYRLGRKHRPHGSKRKTA